MSDKELKNLVILAQQKDGYALDKIVNKFKPCLIKIVLLMENLMKIVFRN